MIQTRMRGQTETTLKTLQSDAQRAVQARARAEEFRGAKLNPDQAERPRIRERRQIEEDPERWDGMS